MIQGKIYKKSLTVREQGFRNGHTELSSPKHLKRQSRTANCGTHTIAHSSIEKALYCSLLTAQLKWRNPMLCCRSIRTVFIYILMLSRSSVFRKTEAKGDRILDVTEIDLISVELDSHTFLQKQNAVLFLFWKHKLPLFTFSGVSIQMLWADFANQGFLSNPRSKSLILLAGYSYFTLLWRSRPNSFGPFLQLRV